MRVFHCTRCKQERLGSKKVRAGRVERESAIKKASVKYTKKRKKLPRQKEVIVYFFTLGLILPLESSSIDHRHHECGAVEMQGVSL